MVLTSPILFKAVKLLTTLIPVVLAMSQSSSKPKVLVTGSNGYLGSHIVKKLLLQGYHVNAAVRDAKSSRCAHLLDLQNAKDQLTLHSIGDLTTTSFDECMKDCSAVFHVATPLTPKFTGDFDGERDIYQPAMASTQELLNCIERNAATVKCIVLTSSMSAVAPVPEPAIKDESCWSDSERQKSRGNWYGATKTDQEKLVEQWAEDAKEKGIIDANFKFTAICPTMIIGPALNNSADVAGTMGTLQNWFLGKKEVAPNDSMSFIHVDDCAAMHVAAMEKSTASGRYMSLVESWHWNDIAQTLKELYPNMPEMKLYEGDDMVTPTKFNLEKMQSLGVQMKSIRETLDDSLAYLKSVGAL